MQTAGLSLGLDPLMLKHRLSTWFHCLHLSWDNICNCLLERPICSPSVSVDCLHVFQSFPLFHFLCGFLPRACQTVVLGGILQGCPSQPALSFWPDSQGSPILLYSTLLHCWPCLVSWCADCISETFVWAVGCLLCWDSKSCRYQLQTDCLSCCLVQRQQVQHWLVAYYRETGQ